MIEQQFEPVPGIWRFHLIYLVITIAMGWSIFPFPTFATMLLISLLCFFGILLALTRKWSLESHVLAVAIGFGTPIVIFGRLLLFQALIVFLILILVLLLAHKHLF